jgi:hypothetical protein
MNQENNNADGTGIGAELVSSRTDSRLDDLELEISSCRRSLRKQQAVFVGVSSLLATLLIGGAGQPGSRSLVADDIQAKSLSIIDGEGRIRIVAKTAANGTSQMWWADEEGKLRIGMETRPDGTAVTTWADRSGKDRMQVATLPDGSAMSRWIDSDGKSRTEITTLPQGDAAFALFDRNEKARITAITGQHGYARMSWADVTCPHFLCQVL